MLLDQERPSELAAWRFEFVGDRCLRSHVVTPLAECLSVFVGRHLEKRDVLALVAEVTRERGADVGARVARRSARSESPDEEREDLAQVAHALPCDDAVTEEVAGARPARPEGLCSVELGRGDGGTSGRKRGSYAADFIREHGRLDRGKGPSGAPPLSTPEALR